MSLYNNNLKKIQNLNYVPVGLKNNNFSNKWLRDNTKVNISKKNPYYGEYSFYYWYWKNKLKNKNSKNWVGFCSYRELWGNKNPKKNNNPKSFLLQKAYKEWDNYDAIIGKPIFVNENVKLSKIIKYGKIATLKNPKSIFFQKGRTIKWQFDFFHGVGNIDKAIELLPKKDKHDFKKYIETENCFARGNMFIAKKNYIFEKYFKDVFLWLKKCEKIFGLDLKGYGQKRMYAFLAERYLSYWFKKYTKCLEWPVVYYDLNKE